MWYILSMQAPLILRPLIATERQALLAGLRSAHTFTMRRCQILLASAEGQHTPAIARHLHCDDHTVRNAIHAFHRCGVAALQPKSCRPLTTHRAFNDLGRERLRARVHQSPRTLGKPTSLWTLDVVAQVSFAQGLTQRQVSGETIRATLLELGVRWKRANHWITSPDPESLRKKHCRDRWMLLAKEHPTWALGFADEVWWSRLAQPDQHGGPEQATPIRLQELTYSKADPDPKAVACYGLLLRQRSLHPDQLLLRFVDGRPVSAMTIEFLAWWSQKLSGMGITGLFLVWENASWHKSQAVRTWLRTHNQQVKQTGAGVRIISCLLPTKSPWLNPIEPKWVHGKRAVSEPDRMLTAAEVEQRVYAYYRSAFEDHLPMPEKAA